MKGVVVKAEGSTSRGRRTVDARAHLAYRPDSYVTLCGRLARGPYEDLQPDTERCDVCRQGTGR